MDDRDNCKEKIVMELRIAETKLGFCMVGEVNGEADDESETIHVGVGVAKVGGGRATSTETTIKGTTRKQCNKARLSIPSTKSLVWIIKKKKKIELCPIWISKYLY